MPYKKGGGNHLQYYDETDGEYDEETKKKINDADKKALTMVHYFDYPFNELTFHWPIQKLHDQEYLEMFVKQASKSVKTAMVAIEKCGYLLKFDAKKDKSKFLLELGYAANDASKLRNDILCGTDLRTLSFSRYTSDCLSCIAKTTLNNKIVTTVWELKRDFTIRLITLIPGGDKQWK